MPANADCPRPKPEPNSVGLVTDVLRERTAAQLAQIDGLDTKATAALGFAGVLVGLMFANSSIDAEWNAWMTIAVILLVLSALALAGSLWVRGWMNSPSSADLYANKHLARAITEAVLAGGLEKALADNRKWANRKARAIKTGLALLAAAIAVAAVGLLVARADLPATTSGHSSALRHPVITCRHRQGSSVRHHRRGRSFCGRRPAEQSHPGATTGSHG